MIYVMSDIHGNLRRFNSIMEQIDLAPDDTLYVLGDVIDRYPDGIRILRKLMSMKNVKMIMGNHEYMMLDVLYKNDEGLSAKDQYKYDQRVRLWYDNGGLVTHNYLKRIKKSVRAEIFSYLKSLPVNIDISVNGINYKLVHAAPEEMYYEFLSTGYRDSQEFSVWYRLGSNESIPGEYTLIFGHTPTYHYSRNLPMSICHKRRFICIDCGAGTPETADYRNGFCFGRLACLRLDDMKEFYSEEGDEYENTLLLKR